MKDTLQSLRSIHIALVTATVTLIAFSWPTDVETKKFAKDELVALYKVTKQLRFETFCDTHAGELQRGTLLSSQIRKKGLFKIKLPPTVFSDSTFSSLNGGKDMPMKDSSIYDWLEWLSKPTPCSTIPIDWTVLRKKMFEAYSNRQKSVQKPETSQLIDVTNITMNKLLKITTDSIDNPRTLVFFEVLFQVEGDDKKLRVQLSGSEASVSRPPEEAPKGDVDFRYLDRKINSFKFTDFNSFEYIDSLSPSLREIKKEDGYYLPNVRKVKNQILADSLKEAIVNLSEEIENSESGLSLLGMQVDRRQALIVGPLVIFVLILVLAAHLTRLLTTFPKHVTADDLFPWIGIYSNLISIVLTNGSISLANLAVFLLLMSATQTSNELFISLVFASPILLISINVVKKIIYLRRRIGIGHNELFWFPENRQ